MHKQQPPRTLYTIGHSTRTVETLIAMLHGAAVTRVVDIRSIPRSRTNPQFNQDALPGALAHARIAYVQLAALGGRRSKQRGSGDENAGWRVQAFKNYADYAWSAPFGAGLNELLALAANETCAIMCSEAVWWRCHRRIVSDYVLARGVPVVHLLSETKQEPAALTPFAVLGSNGRIAYPASEAGEGSGAVP